MKSHSQVIIEEVPCGFFLRTVIVNRGNSCELKPRKKNILFLRQWPDLYQFSKVSKRTNPLKLKVKFKLS